MSDDVKVYQTSDCLVDIQDLMKGGEDNGLSI